MVRASLAVIAMLVLVSACTPRPQKSESSVFTTTPTQTVGVVIIGTIQDMAGAPIAGASVKATSTGQVETTSDAGGNFELPSLDIYPGATVYVRVERSGYITGGQVLKPSGGVTRLSGPIRLVELLPLPIDGTTSGELKPTDFGDYVGAPYDSDYVWHAKHYSFETPRDADVQVELSWGPAGNAALMLWALDGTFVSQPAGGHQELLLPRNSNGILLVGQPYAAGALSQVVTYTLQTHRK